MVGSSSHGQATRNPADVWARIHLIRGSSGGSTWAIDGHYREARLSIGCAPDAGWPVLHEAVEPVHFELFWDGRTLWAGNTHRAPNVFVDGVALADWRQIRGRAEIVFGAAALLVETSSPETPRMQSAPGDAPRVTLAPILEGQSGEMAVAFTEIDSEQTRIEGALSGEATRIAAPLDAADELPADATRIAEELPADATRIATDLSRPPAHAPEVASMQSGARLEIGRPHLGGTPGREPAATMTAEEFSQHMAEAMRMMSTPAQPGAAPGLAAPAPAFPPAGPSAAPSASVTGGFHEPPSFDEARAGAKNRLRLPPPRTLILLAVTALAIAFVLATRPRGDAGAPTVTTARPVSGSDPASSGGAPSGPPPPAAMPIEPSGGSTPERAAADAVIHGRYEEALARYRALAAAQSDRPEYTTMIRILTRRIAARCQGGLGPDGRPCTTPSEP